MDTQNKIIVKSLKLFKAQGIKEVSMMDIAKTLRISKKTLYVYFTSKNDLVNKGIQFLFDLHFSTLERILQEKTATEEKIRKVYEYAINYLIGVSPIFILDLKKYYASSYRDYDLYRRKLIFGYIKNILDEGQLNGEINHTINTQLFCEFHLYNFDKILLANSQLYKYSVKDLFDISIGVSLKGILK